MSWEELPHDMMLEICRHADQPMAAWWLLRVACPRYGRSTECLTHQSSTRKSVSCTSGCSSDPLQSLGINDLRTLTRYQK